MNDDGSAQEALEYLRAIRLNERKIAAEWRDSKTASARRNAADARFLRLIQPQREKDPNSVVILSSKASAAVRDAVLWGDRADASASVILILADRLVCRLHKAIASGKPIDWAAGDSIAGVPISQGVVAGANAIRHADEWRGMLLNNGKYNQTHPNFNRAKKSITILQSLLQDSRPVIEPRSADVVAALSLDGEFSSDVLIRRLYSVASSVSHDLDALKDELEAEDEYTKADFDFVL